MGVIPETTKLYFQEIGGQALKRSESIFTEKLFGLDFKN